MSNGRNSIQKWVAQLVNDITIVRTDDAKFLARIYARLEQITEGLREQQPVVAELAYALSKAVEHIVMNPPAAEHTIEVISRGIRSLQRLHLALEDTVVDRHLFGEIARLSGVRATPAGGSDESLENAQAGDAPEEDAETPDGPEDQGATSEEKDWEAIMEAEEEPAQEADAEMSETPANEESNPAPEDTEASDDVPDIEASNDPDTPQEILERISLDIMTIGLDDLSGLGQIDNGLEALSEAFSAEQPVAFGLAKTLITAINAIIMDEYGDVDDPLAVVAEGISMMQQLDLEFHRLGHESPADPDVLQTITHLYDPESTPETSSETEASPVDDTPDVDEPEPSVPDMAPPAFELDADILADFTSEAEEHLESAESLLLSLENEPENAETLNAVFRAFHTVKGGAGFLNLNDIVRVAHIMEDILDNARKGKCLIQGDLLDLVFESVDLLKTLIEAVQIQLEGATPPPTDVAGFLSKAAAVTSKEIEGHDPEKTAQPNEVKTDAPAPAGNTLQQQTDSNQAKASGQASPRDQHYVRVGTEKLDQLVNLVGELVIAQTQVSQNPEILDSQNQKLTKDISQLVKISNDIQEIAMSMRMVPIKSTFERMARLVRDLSRKCGKNVSFQMSGEDTELDKNVVEEIVDPLTHMVRNAVDHGLESPEEREMTDKPETGTVTLDAYHMGGNIVIELKEDGRGLDRDKILKKAIERGLAQPEDNPTDQEIANFIFLAGFSTADKISDVSGRGVGMDVVRRSIEGLRGKVEVHTEPGKGSTFTIRLPLTLAIIDGMVIGVGEDRYILPLTSIVRSLRPLEDDVFTVMNEGEMVKVQDELFPLVRLYERFDVTPEHQDPCEGLVVVIEAEKGRCCLLVDELVGMQQVVIKGLDEDLRNEEALSGCAILGDGRVGLIMDANGLVNSTNSRAAQNDAYKSAS